jgi:hypothetical protein
VYTHGSTQLIENAWVTENRSGVSRTVVKMDKKYFDGGPFQVLPMVLGIMLSAPVGLAILRWLGLKVTELPMLVSGSISGALVVIVSWLFMVLVGQALAKK